MITQNEKEYADAWRAAPEAGETADSADPFAQGWKDADKLAGGLSIQTQKGLNDLERELSGPLPTPEPAGQRPQGQVGTTQRSNAEALIDRLISSGRAANRADALKQLQQNDRSKGYQPSR